VVLDRACTVGDGQSSAIAAEDGGDLLRAHAEARERGRVRGVRPGFRARRRACSAI